MRYREAFSQEQRRNLEDCFHEAIRRNFIDRVINVPASILAELLRKFLDSVVLAHIDTRQYEELKTSYNPVPSPVKKRKTPKKKKR